MMTMRTHVGLVVILSMVSVSAGKFLEYNHHDRQFNVMALTDLYGAVAERYTYTAAGKSDIYDAAGTTLRTASAVGNPYLFTSRRWDVKTGNYYFRARFQRPSIAGQFLNRDPLEYPDGHSMYAPFFAQQMLTDPNGFALGDFPTQIAYEADVFANSYRMKAYNLHLWETKSRGTCVLVVQMNIEFKFLHHLHYKNDNKMKWDEKEKKKYIIEWVKLVKKIWEDKYKIFPKKGSCCNSCKNGTTVEFSFNTSIDSKNNNVNWTHNVYKSKYDSSNSTNVGRNIVTGANFSLLVGGSPEPLTDSKQIPAVHEFGHMLGLHDEYKINKNEYRKGYITLKDWNDDKLSIMNEGHEVRPRHYVPFSNWMTKKLKNDKKPCSYIVRDSSGIEWDNTDAKLKP